MVILSFAIFYMLVKPDIKTIIKIAISLVAIPIIPRYILSSMSEALFFSGMVIVSGLIINMDKFGFTKVKLIVCYIVIIYLAACRPYFLAFSLIPMGLHFMKNRKESVLFGIAAICIGAALYFFYINPRCTEAFSANINTEIFKVLLTDGPIAFVIATYNMFVEGITELYNLFKSNHMEAIVPHLVILITSINLIINAYYDIRKNKKEKLNAVIIQCISVFVIFVIIMSMLLMYLEYASSRHMIALCVFMILMVSVYTQSNKKIVSLMVAVIMFFIGWSGVKNNGVIYKLPTTSGYEFSEIPNSDDAELLKNAFICNEDEVSWDNTIAFECDSNSNFNYFYYLPKYAGVNICEIGYLADNIERLKSKYVLAYSDSTLDYEGNGWKKIVSGKEIALYEKIR